MSRRPRTGKGIEDKGVLVGGNLQDALDEPHRLRRVERRLAAEQHHQFLLRLVRMPHVPVFPKVGRRHPAHIRNVGLLGDSALALVHEIVLRPRPFLQDRHRHPPRLCKRRREDFPAHVPISASPQLRVSSIPHTDILTRRRGGAEVLHPLFSVSPCLRVRHFRTAVNVFQHDRLDALANLVHPHAADFRAPCLIPNVTQLIRTPALQTVKNRLLIDCPMPSSRWINQLPRKWVLYSIHHSLVSNRIWRQGICAFPRGNVVVRVFVFLVHLRRARQFVRLPAGLLGVGEDMLHFTDNPFRVVPRGVGALPRDVGDEAA